MTRADAAPAVTQVPDGSRSGPTVVFWVGATVLATLWLAWIRVAYVDWSEGAYLLSARELLHSEHLYRSLVAAQPPGLYLTARVVLSVKDSIWATRVVLAALAVVQGWLVMALTRRVVEGAWLPVVTGLVAVVAPWRLRGRSWTPEMFVAPLLLAAVLVGDRESGAVPAGIAGALAVAFKVSYGLPALAIALTSARPRRAVVAFGLSIVALTAGFTAVFGRGLFVDVILGQARIGTAAPRLVFGLWRLGALETGPLIVLAGAGWWLGRRTEAASLVRTLGAGCLAALALTVTVFKYGTGLGNLSVVEPLALPLAALGAWQLCRLAPRPKRLGVVATTSTAVWTLAQSVSLVVTPLHPVLSYVGNSWAADNRQVAVLVRQATACPPNLPYSGDPYIAFLADRRLPGRQADPFIITSPVHRDAQRRAAADRPTCPDSSAAVP